MKTGTALAKHVILIPVLCWTSQGSAQPGEGTGAALTATGGRTFGRVGAPRSPTAPAVIEVPAMEIVTEPNLRQQETLRSNEDIRQENLRQAQHSTGPAQELSAGALEARAPMPVVSKNTLSVEEVAALPLAGVPVTGNAVTGATVSAERATAGEATVGTAQLAPAKNDPGQETVDSIAKVLDSRIETAQLAVKTNESQALPVTSATSNFNQSILVVGGLLLLFAGAGTALVKLKQRGAFLPGVSTRNLEIIETIAMGSKRSISLIRVRGEEFVVSNTEQGISFLTALSPAYQHVQNPRIGTREEFAGATAQQKVQKLAVAPSSETRRRAAELSRLAANASAAKSNREHLEADNNEKGLQSSVAVDEAVSSGEARRSLLSAALQNLKSKGSQPAAGPQTAVGQHFPKYLANAFAQEGNRKLPKREAVSAPNQADDQKLEDVTNLIREKLKEMKPLG